MTTYDPQRHHRKSIRLKSHDYAGGGEYFITACAHREFIAQEKGRPFELPGMRELIVREWERAVGAPFMGAAETGIHEEGKHETCPYVIMPDHFHGLVSLPAGVALGDVIGAFKSKVVHEVVAGVKRGEFPPFPGKIWHRNYYEKIVRSAKERAAIETYIRLNPARLVFLLDGAAAFGNPAIWEMKKIGVLASGDDTPESPPLREGWAWMSGFHSEQERSVLSGTDAPAIRVAAVAPDHVGLTDDELRRLAAGRLLVICPFEAERTTRENALQRNRLVAQWCNKLWIPSARKGGSLETLSNEYRDKRI
jgi:REP element-mobilizing transposase RayT